MRQVKVTTSGIRGLVDRGLDLGRVIDLVSAFGTWLEGAPVLVARDTRPSSPMLACSAISALSAAGCDVLDAGICPTAVAQSAAARNGAGGAVVVTASHSSALWNGLKLFGDKGQVLSSAEGEEILDLWHQGDYLKARHDQLGAIRRLDDAVDGYLAALLSFVDRQSIAEARLRVVVDAGNGAGAMVVPELCRELGVELIPISCEASGRFSRPPNPTEESLAQAAAIMKPVAAKVGFGFSSDCERVSLLTDDGIALGTGATLPLLVAGIAEDDGGKTTVVTTAATDSRTERVARARGFAVVRTGVGVQAVIESMRLSGALIGGEGSGGVALARFLLGFDGLAVMARLLEQVARAGDSRTLASALPPVHARSATVPCTVSRAYSAVAQLRDEYAGQVIDLDGIRVDLDSGWFHIRVSHTESVIRVGCEAATAQEADEMVARLQRRVQAAIHA